MSDRRCPSLAELIDRAFNALTNPGLEARIEAGSPEYARREAVVATLLRVASQDPWPEVPAAWRQRALDLAQPPPSEQPGSSLRRVREFVASLVPDFPAPAAGALALRGPGPADRHLLFEAGPYEIDVALLDSGALAGQVLASGSDEAPLEDGVCVLFGENELVEAPLLNGGDFHFDRIRPGAYNLLCESPSLRLFVPNLDLSSAGGAGA